MSLHARGHIDDAQRSAQLQAIETRVQSLRDRHGAVNLLIELLGHPRLLGRPVLTLLVLAVVMSALAGWH